MKRSSIEDSKYMLELYHVHIEDPMVEVGTQWVLLYGKKMVYETPERSVLIGCCVVIILWSDRINALESNTICFCSINLKNCCWLIRHNSKSKVAIPLTAPTQLILSVYHPQMSTQQLWFIKESFKSFLNLNVTFENWPTTCGAKL
jgi:hypothetical protein